MLPAASAAATPPQGIASGKFQGETTTTTPLPRGREARQLVKAAGRLRSRSGRSRSPRRLPGRLRRASCRPRPASRPSTRRARRRARRQRDAGSSCRSHGARSPPTACVFAGRGHRAIDVGVGRLQVAGDDRARPRRIERLARVAAGGDLLAGDHQRHLGGPVATSRLANAFNDRFGPLGCSATSDQSVSGSLRKG